MSDVVNARKNVFDCGLEKQGNTKDHIEMAPPIRGRSGHIAIGIDRVSFGNLRGKTRKDLVHAVR
jgi:hypothetical protein